MDASQIAQIRGSFTNWIAANPDSATELFNNYDLTDTWEFGSGAPSIPVGLGVYYFDVLTGDVYLGVTVDLVVTWIYQCNLFDSHSSRTVTQVINYTDLNTGTSPSASFTFNLLELQKNEIVTDVFINILDQFSDSASNNDCSLSDIYDTTNVISLFTAALSRNLELLPGVPPLNIGQVSSHKDALLIYADGLLVNFPATFRVLAAIFTATDLTLLTAGQLQIVFKIETINAAD